MSNRSIALMIACLGMLLLGLFLTNWRTIARPAPENTFLSPTEVRGISIEHDGKLWPLDFRSQLFAIAFLNDSSKIERKSGELVSDKLEITRILIHRFNKNDLEVAPIAMVDNQLVFRQSQWNPYGYLKDQSQGKLQELIANSFDL